LLSHVWRVDFGRTAMLPFPDTSSATSGRARGWRRTALPVAATAALNAVFWLAVDRTASTRQHLTITLDGSSVSARVGRYAAATWDGAPRGVGRLGFAITRREFEGEAGVDDIAVTSLHGGAAAVRDSFRDQAAWTTTPTWRRQARGFVTTERAVLWSRQALCGDCRIELDLLNARGVDILLRAVDDRNGLLLRWQDESLAWHATTDGESGGAHGMVHYALSREDLSSRFAAQVAWMLRRGYLDGWRFLWWYARAASFGLLLVVLLGIFWRTRRPFPLRWQTWRDKFVARRHPISLVVGGILAAAAALSAWHWPRERVLFGATGLAFVALAACLGVLTGRELTRVRAVQPERIRRLRAGASTIAVLMICTAAAGYSAFAARVYLEGIPHVQDSASYLLAAKAIASGHLRVPIDPALAPFFELGLFFEHHDGFLYPLVPGLYFAGHPALLALGVLLHAPWIVNPMTSGITLGLLFLLCRELFGTSTGILAVALGAISPFARFQSASMMSHPSSLLFVTATLLSLVYWFRRRRPVFALCMGAALGALLNVRPFDAAVLGGYIGLVLLVRARSLGSRTLFRMGLTAAAAFAPFALFLFCQTAVLGAALNPAARELLQWLPENIEATWRRLEDLNLHLFGWSVVPGLPPELTIGVLLVALLVIPKTRADWFIAGWAFLYVGAYAITDWHANMFGPRYWYGSIGGQLVLVARLLQILASLVTRLSRALWPPGGTHRWHWIPASVGVVPMVVVAGSLFWGTVQTFPRYFRREYDGNYNGFDAEPLRLLADRGVAKGLVFVAELPRWQHLVTAIVANDISFAGDLIFARHIDGRDHLLIAAHPDHPPYLMTWNGRALELHRLQIDAVSHDPILLPADPDDPRVIGDSNIFRGMKLPLGAGLVGGLATDGSGNLYVVDSADHEVLIFDAGGFLRRRLSTSYGFGPGSITAGQGIAVDSDRNVYVANLTPPGVVRFNADGTFGWRARQSPTGDERLTEPIGIAMLADGDLVVTNADPPDLHVLRRDGSFAGSYARGAARAALRRPIGVAVGTNRHLYVSDAELKALLEIDEEGRAVRRWPLPVNAARPFQSSYVAVDPRGHAYVSDFNALVLYHVRPDKPGAEVIGPSETAGEPSGITTRDSELLVIEGSYNKILRMRLP
jgi:hypothetical protein